MAQRSAGQARRRRDGRTPEPPLPPAHAHATPPPPGGLGAEGLTAAVLGGAALGAAGTVAVAALPPAAALSLSAAAILAAFERFLDGRDRVLESTVFDLLEAEYDEVEPDLRVTVLDEEMAAERAYRAKVRARLDRDLPTALSIADPATRELEVRKVLDRERRIVGQREEAVAIRALGNAEARVVEAASPEAGYWYPSPNVREHTLDCLAMGWKLWPWTVLRSYRPPLHTGCACEVKTVQEARRLNLPGAWGEVQRGDMAFFDVQEYAADRVVDELGEDELLRVLEARREQERFAEGTTKGGQFKPRRGGVPGRPTGARSRRRVRRRDDADEEVGRVARATREEPPLITKKKAGDLKVGDKVLAGGEWHTVEGVDPNTPGYVVLDDLGPVLLDAGKDFDVQEVARDEPAPGPDVPEADLDPLTLEAGDVVVRMRSAVGGKIGQGKKGGGEFFLPGGVKITAGDKPGRMTIKASYEKRNYTVTADGASVPAYGEDAAVLAALRMSAASVHPDSLGGERKLNHWQEAWLTDAQRATLKERGLTGWGPGGVPVTGRKFHELEVRPDGRVRDMDYGDAQRVDRVDVGLTPDPETNPGGEGAAGAGGRGGPDGASSKGLPELPEPGPGDRYRLRYDGQAGIEMVEVDGGRVERAWPGEWDLEDVLKVLAGANAMRPPEVKGPDGARTEMPSFEQIESALLTKTIGAAGTEPGALLPGFAYLGKGSKVSYKREVLENGDLGLPDGFFRQGRDRREGIIFGHMGTRLIDALSDDELEGLSAAGLGKRAAIVEGFRELNGPGHDGYRTMNPDAAEALARIASTKGYPVHPDISAWIGERGQEGGRERQERSMVDELSEAVTGRDDVAALDVLQKAGYSIAGYGLKPTRVYVRNFDRRSTLSVTFGDNDRVSRVEELEAPDLAVDRDVAALGTDNDLGARLARAEGADGLGFRDVSSEFPWDVYTHPDGRSVAVRSEDGQIKETRAVAALPDAVERARNRARLDDPIGNISAGDNFEEVRNTFTGPNSIFRMSRAYEGDDDALKAAIARGTLPAGVTDVIDFKTGAKDWDRRDFRLFLRPGPDGRLVVERVGRPGIWPHEAMEEGPFTALVTQWEEGQKKIADEKAARDKETADRLAALNNDLDAIVRGPNAKEDLAGQKPREVVERLEAAGWYLEEGKRGRVAGQRGVTYKLRSRAGETLTMKAVLSWQGSGFESIKLEANPQGGKRTRVRGRLPKSKKELYVDALGRGDEVADRHGGVAFNTAIFDEGAGRNAAAVHHWSGSIAMGNGKHLKLGAKLDSYLKKRAKGEELTDQEHFGFYDALSTLQHELNHGVGAPGGEAGGLAFGTRHYRKDKPWEMAMEEALTEETARVLTLEWLRSWGPDADPILQAVARRQRSKPPGQRGNVYEGSYRDYRAKLKRVFDDAKVEDAERRDLLMRMKFEMTPEERMVFLDDRMKVNGAPGVSPTKTYLTSRAGTPEGPVYDEPLDDVVVPERPGDNAVSGDRIKFRDAAGDEQTGIIRTAYGDFSGFAVEQDNGQQVYIQTSAVIETGESVPMAAMPKVQIRVRGGSRVVSIGDSVTILDDPFPGQQMTGRIVGITPSGAGNGAKLDIALPDGTTITRYSRMTRWGS